MSLILPGAEPFMHSGGPTGCLLIHGFTATPQEMHGLGEHLASEGYTTLGIRLAGHGTRPADLARSRWSDWMASLEDGYHILRGACDRVVLMGLSLGGALALLASRILPSAGVVAMSTPLLQTGVFVRFAARPISLLYPFVPKRPANWRDPQAATERVAYPCYPTRAVAEVAEVQRVLRSQLSSVDCPVLLIHSQEDIFVPPKNSRAILEGIRSTDKELVLIERSTHVITCDAAREQVFEAAARFVRRQSERPV